VTYFWFVTHPYLKMYLVTRFDDSNHNDQNQFLKMSIKFQKLVTVTYF